MHVVNVSGEIVDRGHPVSIFGIKTIVAPFPLGNGPTQKNFSERMRLASESTEFSPIFIRVFYIIYLGFGNGPEIKVGNLKICTDKTIPN